MDKSVDRLATHASGPSADRLLIYNPAKRAPTVEEVAPAPKRARVAAGRHTERVEGVKLAPVKKIKPGAKLVALMADKNSKPAVRGALLRRIADSTHSTRAELEGVCDLGGLDTMRSWLDEAGATVLANRVASNVGQRRLKQVLAALSNLPMTLAWLKESGLGKAANSLRKKLGIAHPEMAELVATLVNRWKELMVPVAP